MPTAASSTDVGRGAGPQRRPRPDVLRDAVRAVVDLVHLVRFRVGTLRHPMITAGAAACLLLFTAAVAWLPSLHPEAGQGGAATDVLILLPTALAAFVLLAIVSAAASGGGRELLARDPAAVHPISATTDHLGALLLAPLNIAWMLQAWALLGFTAFAVGSEQVVRAHVLLVLWLVAGTAFAQVLAWILEGVRRVPHGIAGIRLLTVVLLGTALGLQLTDRIIAVFDQIPTRYLVAAMASPDGSGWLAAVGILLGASVVLVVVGAVPAHIAAHRTPREELRVESGHYEARPSAQSDLGMMVRIDRGSVWRAVPMRRGVVVLALGPGLVALLGGLQWSTMTLLPCLVASGGALLYGVNAWCLDSRGALWRESLPVDPRTVFDSRALVLAEFLLVASLATVAIAGLRAGVPSVSELTALVATLLVVTLQVVGASMRWSSQRPHAVDLRSARATPAPPALMVGYSARLAFSTTVTGLFFAALAYSDRWLLSVLFAVTMLAWSGLRLMRVRRAWSDPTDRARIITTVAAA